MQIADGWNPTGFSSTQPTTTHGLLHGSRLHNTLETDQAGVGAFKFMEGEWPHILITGTPGTGKTKLSEYLKKRLTGSYKVIGVSEVVRRKGLYEEYDAAMDTLVIDERACRRYLRHKLKDTARPLILESHTISVIPHSLIQLCVVVTVPTTHILYDRLAARGYSTRKIEENMDCEIMQECLQEAHETFAQQLVVEVRGETETDLEEAIETISHCIANWQRRSPSNAPER